MRATEDVEWTRANLREVLPDLPSPFAVDFTIRYIGSTPRRGFGSLVGPTDRLGPSMRAINGRVYMNLTQLRWMSRSFGLPPALGLRAFGHDAVSDEDEAFSIPSLSEIVGSLPSRLRVVWRRLTFPIWFRRSLTRLRREAAELAAGDPEVLSDEEIWRVFEAHLERGDGPLGAQAIIGMFLSEVYLPITLVCRALDVAPDPLIDAHLGLAETVSGAQAGDLLRLARLAREDPAVREALEDPSGTEIERLRTELTGTPFLEAFEGFLARYGHRGPYESDLARPRYREDPKVLLQAVVAHQRSEYTPSPEQAVSRRRAAATEAWRRVRAQARGWRRLLHPVLRFLLRRGRHVSRLREFNRSEFVRVWAELRRYLMALADRFVDRGWIEGRDDFFFLHLEDIAKGVEGDGQNFPELVAARKQERTRWTEIDMPTVVRNSEVPPLERGDHVRAPEAPVRTALKGQCLSAGVAEGPVVVLHEPTDLDGAESGMVLVAPATDPAWTPLFTLAAAVIVEVGGLVSHAAVVARELGIPALGNVSGATRRLRNGDHVRIDATNGDVEVLR